MINNEIIVFILLAYLLDLYHQQYGLEIFYKIRHKRIGSGNAGQLIHLEF